VQAHHKQHGAKDDRVLCISRLAIIVRHAWIVDTQPSMQFEYDCGRGRQQERHQRTPQPYEGLIATTPRGRDFGRELPENRSTERITEADYDPMPPRPRRH
jgi:hypothetical protein